MSPSNSSLSVTSFRKLTLLSFSLPPQPPLLRIDNPHSPIQWDWTRLSSYPSLITSNVRSVKTFWINRQPADVRTNTSFALPVSLNILGTTDAQPVEEQARRKLDVNRNILVVTSKVFRQSLSLLSSTSESDEADSVSFTTASSATFMRASARGKAHSRTYEIIRRLYLMFPFLVILSARTLITSQRDAVSIPSASM